MGATILAVDGVAVASRDAVVAQLAAKSKASIVLGPPDIHIPSNIPPAGTPAPPMHAAAAATAEATEVAGAAYSRETPHVHVVLAGIGTNGAEGRDPAGTAHVDAPPLHKELQQVSPNVSPCMSLCMSLCMPLCLSLHMLVCMLLHTLPHVWLRCTRRCICRLTCRRQG